MMNGDKGKKGGYELRSNSERESETEAEASETLKQDGGRRATETLDSIRAVVSEVMTTGMAALQTELKKDLSDFRTCFREDIKKQMDEFISEVDRKIQDVTGQIEGAVKCVGQMEENMLVMERWDVGVKDTLTQLLTKQRALQEKVTDLEGRSRRNNIRIYGVPEDAEGQSAVTFIENLIETELGSELGRDLGIERAHHGTKTATECPSTIHGTVTYNSAAHAAEDLRRRGYAVGEIPGGRTRSKDISEETLARLLPWETTEARPDGKSTGSRSRFGRS